MENNQTFENGLFLLHVSQALHIYRKTVLPFPTCWFSRQTHKKDVEATSSVTKSFLE